MRRGTLVVKDHLETVVGDLEGLSDLLSIYLCMYDYVIFSL